MEHYIRKADLEYNDTVRAEALRWCQARGQRSAVRHISSQTLDRLAAIKKWYNYSK